MSHWVEPLGTGRAIGDGYKWYIVFQVIVKKEEFKMDKEIQID